MERITYQKRPGTSGIAGQIYEQKLIALVYAECLINWRRGTISSFSIAANADGCDAFDDIVVQFNYNKDQVGRCRRLFIQAKHRENNTKKPTSMETLFSYTGKNDFSLAKYLEAVITIKKNSQHITKMFNKEPDEIDYIIYTNNTYNKTSKDTAVVEIQDYQIPINILVDKDQNYKINLEHEKCEVFKAYVKNHHKIRTDDSTIKEYLDNLKLFFNQAGEKKLEEILKERLASCYEFFDADLHYLVAFNRIQNWWKNEDFLLTDKEDLFLETIFLKHTQDCKAKLEEFEIQFSSKSLDSLSKLIEQHNLIQISTDENAEFLHLIRVCQSLEKMKMTYAICNTKIHETIFDQESIGLSNQVQCLVIRVDNSFSDTENLEKKIPNKKLIVISDRSVSIVLNENLFLIEDYDFGWSDFDDETRGTLEDKSVAIRGDEYELGWLVGDEGFNNNFLIKMIKKKQINLGEVAKNVYENRKTLARQAISNVGKVGKEFLSIIQDATEDIIETIENFDFSSLESSDSDSDSD